jgi:hypothetical protein
MQVRQVFQVSWFSDAFMVIWWPLVQLRSYQVALLTGSSFVAPFLKVSACVTTSLFKSQI